MAQTLGWPRARHWIGNRRRRKPAKALEQVVPERCCPQIYKMGMPTVIFGTHPKTGQLFIDHLSKLKRSIALRKSAKLKRKGD